MPTDEDRRTITVAADFDRVLATVRDVGSQPEWVPEIRTAEVLERNEDGTPAKAHFTASTAVGTDDYTLSYVHHDDGLAWSLVKGRLQTGQEARYTLKPLGEDSTEVTFTLRISHNLPLPGFLRRRVIGNLVDNTVNGLKGYVEA